MASIPLKVPFPRLLNQGGSAGTRRLLVIGGCVVLGSAAVAVVTIRNSSDVPTTTLAKTPVADPLPGGQHTTPVYSDIARRADQDKAAKAAVVGKSSVATMPGSETAVAIPTPPPEQPVLADRTTALTSRPAPPPAARAQANPQLGIQTAAAQSTRPDENQSKAYGAAISSLLAGWNGKAQATEVVLTPDDRNRSSGNATTADTLDTRARPLEPASSATPVSNARMLGGQNNGGRVLMPAGRGIYGRTVLASRSDQGGPVIVEALSGPIVGNRMTGSFEARSDRLVVHLDSITLQDGTQHKIDALVTSPDTLETSVASSVDQHYMSRYVLPVAAAFVSGLGQSLAQSNSTVVAGPLGGATAFQRLNLGQQLGVGAGAAANQFGAAVTSNAPKGPTVTLDANANVGVVFLSPLVVGENR